MTKINKETDYVIWFIRNYARGISTFVISLWVIMAVGYSIDTASYQTSTLTNEGVILSAFLLVTLVSVIIAWWWEGVGGLMLTIVGIVAIVVFMLTNKPEAYWITLVTGVPFLVSGILYLKCWRRIKSKTYQDIPNKESDATSYCPKCKAQYREGFFECSDCGVKLEKFESISH
jgi:hypothetical protein